MISFSFFDGVGPGCEFSGKGLSGIGVERGEFELGESLDSLGVVDNL